MCPVCKTSTYLNKRMVFMVNPECYHKMCDSCVERIFAAGPAPCPVAGCHKTLRKARFKVPRFEDLSVERDCDIRARVEQMSVSLPLSPFPQTSPLFSHAGSLTTPPSSLNRQEDEFETLRAYNDYAEWKESLVQNLVAGTDVAATEQLLRGYARDHATAIAANAGRDGAARQAQAADETARRDRAARAREAAVREARAEKAQREASRRDIVQHIVGASAGDARRAAREAEAAAERARAAQRARAEGRVPEGVTATASAATATAGGDAGGGGYVIPGLKKVEAAAPEQPYDPFDGLQLRMKYYTLQDSYYHPWSNDVANKPDHTAGGYLPADYQRRAQLEAHAGLGVILAKEKREAP